MAYLLGIDLGSTSLKAMIYDLDGNCAARSSRSTEVVHPDAGHPDWAVWMPDAIWQSTADAIREAVSQIDDKSSIKAVAVTGMGMDGVPIDQSGQWLYPFISWHCPRTAPQHAWWMENVGPAKQFHLTGNPIWPINSALRILWMRQNEPAILDRTHKWLLIEDYVNFMLSGEMATDYSMACNTLLFDANTKDYVDELLTISGINRSMLADPKPSGTIMGEVTARAAEATGLAAGTPVVLGGHDFLCACLPVGAYKPGVVQDVIGTWEIIVAGMAKPVVTPEVRDMGWWIDAHVARDTYAAMGSAVAADMLEWYRREFGTVDGKEADWKDLIDEARQSPPGANGVMFLPHFSGSTIPIIDGQSRGAFAGLRNRVTRGDMLRAIMEGLNFQFLQILKGVEGALQVTPEKFVAVGGGVQNDLWMQAKADAVGKPIEAPDIEEATPLGAAILAGIGIGFYTDEDHAWRRIYKPGKVYEPDPKLTDFYAERFAVYEQMYPALAPVHHQMAGLTDS